MVYISLFLFIKVLDLYIPKVHRKRIVRKLKYVLYLCIILKGGFRMKFILRLMGRGASKFIIWLAGRLEGGR